MRLSLKPSVFDLNLYGTYGHSFPIFREGLDHECWQNCLRPLDGFHPAYEFSRCVDRYQGNYKCQFQKF